VLVQLHDNDQYCLLPGMAVSSSASQLQGRFCLQQAHQCVSGADPATVRTDKVKRADTWLGCVHWYSQG
jgi:hypothetical protein